MALATPAVFNAAVSLSRMAWRSSCSASLSSRALFDSGAEASRRVGNPASVASAAILCLNGMHFHRWKTSLAAACITDSASSASDQVSIFR